MTDKIIKKEETSPPIYPPITVGTNGELIVIFNSGEKKVIQKPIIKINYTEL